MKSNRRASTARVLSETQIKLIARALADTRRFNILRQIGGCDTATPCYEVLSTHPITAATLSHHMKDLEAAGLVISVKDGKFVHYRICREVLDAYIQALTRI